MNAARPRRSGATSTTTAAHRTVNVRRGRSPFERSCDDWFADYERRFYADRDLARRVEHLEALLAERAS